MQAEEINIWLKQSPRCWFDILSNALIQFGPIRCQVEHLVFYKHAVKGSMLLLVYVDDIIIIGNDEKGINELKGFLSNQF